MFQTDYDRIDSRFAALVYCGPIDLYASEPVYATKHEALVAAKSYLANLLAAAGQMPTVSTQVSDAEADAILAAERQANTQTAPALLSVPLASNVRAAVRRLVTVSVLALVLIPALFAAGVYLTLDALCFESEEAAQQDPAMVFLQDLARKAAQDRATGALAAKSGLPSKHSEVPAVVAAAEAEEAPVTVLASQEASSEASEPVAAEEVVSVDVQAEDAAQNRTPAPVQTVEVAAPAVRSEAASVTPAAVAVALTRQALDPAPAPAALLKTATGQPSRSALADPPPALLDALGGRREQHGWPLGRRPRSDGVWLLLHPRQRSSAERL